MYSNVLQTIQFTEQQFTQGNTLNCKNTWKKITLFIFILFVLLRLPFYAVLRCSFMLMFLSNREMFHDIGYLWLVFFNGKFMYFHYKSTISMEKPAAVGREPNFQSKDDRADFCYVSMCKFGSWHPIKLFNCFYHRKIKDN